MGSDAMWAGGAGGKCAVNGDLACLLMDRDIVSHVLACWLVAAILGPIAEVVTAIV